MSNDSTQIDPNVLNEESLEFEFALWNKDIGQGGSSPHARWEAFR
jgi:hypothetical protein